MNISQSIDQFVRPVNGDKLPEGLNGQTVTENKNVSVLKQVHVTKTKECWNLFTLCIFFHFIIHFPKAHHPINY